MYLGNKICVDKEKFNASIDQTSFVDELLARFGLMDCQPVGTPIVVRLTNMDRGKPISQDQHVVYRNMVGNLFYLSCLSRPDICFAVSELSRFVADPGETHMKAAKRVLRYLKGT